jgi:hypothetical protein
MFILGECILLRIVVLKQYVVVIGYYTVCVNSMFP